MASLIPLLTELEKDHISERQPLPEKYLGLSDAEMEARIAAAKAALGTRLVILGHHYQRDEVIRFADYTGDSYKLAGVISKHPEADFIVFCGVHFMAESADVLSAPHQHVILPDLAAGCSMADMAEPEQLEMCWSELEQMGGIESHGADRAKASGIPVTYINSAASRQSGRFDLGRRHRSSSGQSPRASGRARPHGLVARSIRLPVLDDVPRVTEPPAVGARRARRRRGSQPHHRPRRPEALDEGR